MAEVPQPLFPIGTRVFTQDGRTGIVQSADFASAVNGFRYILEGVNDIFEESELQDIPFGISGPPLAGNITPAMFAAALATGDVGVNIREFGLFVEAFGDSLDLFFSEFPSLIDQFRVVVDEPPPPPPPPGIDFDAVLAEVDVRIARVVGAAVAASITARNQLAADFAEQIEGIRGQLLALEQEAQEATGSDLTGLFRLLGSLISDPLGFLLERAEDVIQSEVIDGLNR